VWGRKDDEKKTHPKDFHDETTKRRVLGKRTTGRDTRPPKRRGSRTRKSMLKLSGKKGSTPAQGTHANRGNRWDWNVKDLGNTREKKKNEAQRSYVDMSEGRRKGLPSFRQKLPKELQTAKAMLRTEVWGKDWSSEL